MLTSALYYPHTRIRDPELLKAALVLWDHIEVVVPFKEFVLSGATADENDALALVAKPRVPTRDEKAQVHSQMIDLTSRPIPRWLEFPSDQDWRYLVFPQKFLPETWDALRESRLARDARAPHEFENLVLSKWLGLTMMAALASACAGTTKRMITDEHEAYDALYRYTLAEHEGEMREIDRADNSDARTLVMLSFRAMDLSEVSLKELIALRSNEDAFLRSLRRNYLKALDESIQQLQGARHAGDRAEIERVFEQSMQDDLMQLNHTLKRNAAGVALSKEMLGAVVATVGTAFMALALIPAIGLLGKTWLDYRRAREDVMQRHATSWLYQLRPQVW